MRHPATEIQDEPPRTPIRFLSTIMYVYILREGAQGNERCRLGDFPVFPLLHIFPDDVVANAFADFVHGLFLILHDGGKIPYRLVEFPAAQDAAHDLAAARLRQRVNEFDFLGHGERRKPKLGLRYGGCAPIRKPANTAESPLRIPCLLRTVFFNWLLAGSICFALQDNYSRRI